jgi:hypothetical protein
MGQGIDRKRRVSCGEENAGTTAPFVVEVRIPVDMRKHFGFKPSR